VITRRVLTADEMREEFLDHIAGLVRIWKNTGESEDEKLSGLVHSILATLCGRSGGMPGFDLIPSMHPDDWTDEEVETLWPPIDINDGGLNEQWYQDGKPWPRAKATPEEIEAYQKKLREQRPDLFRE